MFKENYKILKYIVSIIIVLSVVGVSLLAPINVSNAGDTVKKIYHVYASGEYLGAVSDRTVVEKAVEKKVLELNEAYKGIKLTSSSNITYVPEVVFQLAKDINNQEIASLAVAAIKPLQEAYALKLNGQVITYLVTEAEVNQAIKKMKLKYVTEEQLNAVEGSKSGSNNVSSLQVGETRILDVTLSKTVTTEATQVAPELVLSIDNAITFLEQGSLAQDLYEVQSGDVLGSIANKHGLRLKDLLEINPNITENTVLKIGQPINVTVYKPHLAVVVKKELKVTEEIPYETSYVENNDLYKGDTKIQTQGVKGSKSVVYSIVTQNGVQIEKNITETAIVSEPVTQVVQRGTKVVPSRGDGQFSWPTIGGYVSSKMGWRWGRMHSGIDIARPSDKTIKASDNGTVESIVYSKSGKGNHVIINHNNGYKTVYAHLASINVQKGQTVVQGAKIGVMGSTGNSTGVHLHFEILKNGSYVNPLNYIK